MEISSNELPKLLNQINAELERLNWTGAQYREYLTQTYGEKAFIPDTEFRNIFQHLKSLPSPSDAK
jgi:hypothetical protein